MSIKEEAKTTVSLLLLFLSNGEFKVLSLAIRLALLRHWGFLVSFVFPMVALHCLSCTTNWNHFAVSCWNHLTRLSIARFTGEKQRMENCVFNNVLWIFVHTLVLTGLVVAANWFPDTYVYNWYDLFSQKEENEGNINYRTTSLFSTTTAPFNGITFHTTDNFNTTTDNSESLGKTILHSFFDGYKLSSRALVQNLPLLNGLYVVILCTMLLHVVLFYFQMWRPFIRAKEKAMKEEEDGTSPLTFSPTLRGERTNGEGEESIEMLSKD